MLKLSDGMILYHGSYCEVKEPDLEKCQEKKDFGKGFYLTTSKEQAEDFVKSAVKKAFAQGHIDSMQNFGVVSSFKFSHLKNLSEYYFTEADTNWLHCIVGHRKTDTFDKLVEKLKTYDVIAGKIANDKTNVTITTYLLGGYGEIGSKEADILCISQLIPERLQDQYCFRTINSLSCISFIGSEQIWIK